MPSPVDIDARAERLRAARAARYPSAEAAAAALGENPVTLRSHENGQNGFPIDAAIAYAEAYGVSLSWLLTGRAEVDASPPPATPADAGDDLAARVRERLAATGLNPYSAAKAADLGDDYVRDILRGKVNSPSAAGLAQLARVLDTTAEWLLSGCGPASDGASFSEQLRARVEARLQAVGLTPITAATRAGLPRDTIRNLCRPGNAVPRADTLAAIARALGCSASYLLGEEAAPGTSSDQIPPGDVELRLRLPIDLAADVLALVRSRYG